MSISDRIRPNSEAAPWVIEEVRKLEAEAKRLHVLVHRIHALTTEETAWETFPGMSAKYLREIHELTTEAVEHGNG